MDNGRKLLWFSVGFVCGWQALPWLMHAFYIAVIAALAYKAWLL